MVYSAPYENTLATIIDANTSALTWDTYVYSESLTTKLNLDRPFLIDGRIIAVVHPASKTIRQKGYKCNLFLYEGNVVLFAKTVAALKTAIKDLVQLSDTTLNLELVAHGIERLETDNLFSVKIRYEYQAIESKYSTMVD